jgi:hypothetical protein
MAGLINIQSFFSIYISPIIIISLYLDLIAIPEFSRKSVSNWGILLFNEENLLSSKENNSVSLQRVASNVANGIAQIVNIIFPQIYITF